MYFPDDLAREFGEKLLLLGFKVNNAFVCVKFVPWETDTRLLTIKAHPELGDLEVLGCSGGGTKGYFNVMKNSNSKLPILSNLEGNTTNTYTVIMFTLPNFKNLEYFSIEPILLQSMGNYERDPVTDKLLKPYKDSFNTGTETSTIADQDTLDKINIVLKVRLILEAVLQKLGILKSTRRFPQLNGVKKFISPISSFLFAIFSNVILSIQLFTVLFIKILNSKIRNVSLVDISQVCRQLDLRLKQITYFPIQFLCYYDKSILYKDNSILLKELGLPIFNSDLNINNSNYINLYNSIWLIFNDILLGVTTWKLISQHSDRIFQYLNEVVFERLLFNDFYDLISWISYNHPAGFKLNNELGSFMGDLFLWSLNYFNYLIQEHIISKEKNPLFLMLIKGLCYLGVTFLIGLIIDILKLITLHIFWFYYTSARIYQKQVEILKSLVQLFRGKKYNILRNRVDNLDNYSKPRDFFEVDQLLLGTLLFMILVLLLPTIFAFYLTYFIIRLLVILMLNFFENVLLIINFVPLFVILLKLKNSSRLQGGVQFEYLYSSVQNCSYLRLSNKSLTYSEIFKNFAALFKRLKNFRTSIITVFFKGDLISLNHNHHLKFNYLLLPENVEKSIDIWKYFTNSL